MTDFSKQEFRQFWGEGYYEMFDYGIGIEEVVKRCILSMELANKSNNCLEIGCGGGVFTKYLSENFGKVIALDVIDKPARLSELPNVTYYELPDKDYTCSPVKNNTIDFCFSYGVFCHFSNEAIEQYIDSIYKKLKKGGECVIMISDFDKLKEYYPSYDWSKYKFGDCTEIGHFYQNDLTVEMMQGRFQILSRNLTFDHRDIVVHFKK